MVPSERRGGSGHKLKHKKYHLNVRVRGGVLFICLFDFGFAFYCEMVEHCNRLLRQVVKAMSLEILKI